MWKAMSTTVFVTFMGTGVGLLLTTFAAYALSRDTLPGQKILLGLILFTMYFSGGIIPTFLVVKQLGMYDSLTSLYIPQAMSVFNFIVMRTFFRQLPESLEEAARIDGSGEFRTFNSIVLPIMKPAVAVQAIFTFVGSWNNYFVPALIIQSKNKMTVPILIATLRGADYMNFDMGKIYMMITVAIVPIIIIYLLLSKYIIAGVTLGGVKE